MKNQIFLTLMTVAMFSGISCTKQENGSTATDTMRKPTAQKHTKTANSPEKPKAQIKPTNTKNNTPAKNINILSLPIKDIALLYSDKGIFAVSPEGKTITTLLTGKILQALYDPLAKVIWYVIPGNKTSSLYAMDLKNKNKKILIVKDYLPLNSGNDFASLYSFYVKYRQTTVYIPAERAKLLVTLDLSGKTPHFKPTVFEKSEKTANPEKTVKNFKPENTGFLQKIMKSTASLKINKTKAPSLKIPVPADVCGGENLCQEGTNVPGTPLYIAMTSHECEDTCHNTFAIYNSAKKGFVNQKTGKIIKTSVFFSEETEEEIIKPCEIKKSDWFFSKTIKGLAFTTAYGLTTFDKNGKIKKINANGNFAGWLHGWIQ